MPTNETLNKMGEFMSDKEKLIRLLCGSAVMDDGNVYWYNGTLEVMFQFIDKWLFAEILSKREEKQHNEPSFNADNFKSVNSDKCPCWNDGLCWGTKECDPCDCKGDVEKCDFYPDKRGVKF